ncbi:MAG TPA: hypothetical protein PKA10_13950 [Selenomonadales bacterium]|nr:hypothetical protein [Selenomonadales bacterium]
MRKLLLLTFLFLLVFGVTADASAYGSLKGTITWQYNNYVGTKGDVEAKVIVIPDNINSESISETDGTSLINSGIVPQNSGIFYAEADGYGNYEINGLNPGDYSVLIISNKTTRNSNEPIYDGVKQLLLLFLKSNDKIINNYYIKWKKHTVKKVTIREGVTSICSQDFGNTYM